MVAVFDYAATAYPDGDHIAWGNVDPTQVANVGVEVDGNILPEDLLNAQSDVILTLTFDPADASQTAGVIPDLADAIEKIAPVLVVTDMASTEIQLQRLVDLRGIAWRGSRRSGGGCAGVRMKTRWRSSGV